MATGLNSTGKSASGATGAYPYLEYAIDDGYSTGIGNGDLVTLSSGYIIVCPENARPIGVLRGIRYIDASGESKFLNSFPASTENFGTLDGVTDVVALVEPVGDQIFSITTSDAAVSQASIGGVFRLKSLGRDTTTGRSTAVVDMDAAVTTELRLVKILGLTATPGNTFASGAVVDVVVHVVDLDVS